jgi:hypothetical protein
MGMVVLLAIFAGKVDGGLGASRPPGRASGSFSFVPIPLGLDAARHLLRRHKSLVGLLVSRLNRGGLIIALDLLRQDEALGPGASFNHAHYAPALAWIWWPSWRWPSLSRPRSPPIPSRHIRFSWPICRSRQVHAGGLRGRLHVDDRTQLNWGASYLVNDLYRRFMVSGRPERHYVAAAQAATVVLMVLSAVVSFFMSSIADAWKLMISIGAGTGLVYLLRWFWWRIKLGEVGRSAFATSPTCGSGFTS